MWSATGTRSPGQRRTLQERGDGARVKDFEGCEAGDFGRNVLDESLRQTVPFGIAQVFERRERDRGCDHVAKLPVLHRWGLALWLPSERSGDLPGRGIDRSGYREAASFCAIERLPAL